MIHLTIDDVHSENIQSEVIAKRLYGNDLEQLIYNIDSSSSLTRVIDIIKNKKTSIKANEKGILFQVVTDAHYLSQRLENKDPLFNKKMTLLRNKLTTDPVNPKLILLIEALIQHGADLNKVSKKGQTLLFEAIKVGAPNLVYYISKHVNNINFKNNCGEYGLGLASDLNRLDLMEVLLKNGASAKSHSQILFYAFYNDKYDEVKLLLKYGSDPYLKDEDNVSIFSENEKRYMKYKKLFEEWKQEKINNNTD